MYGDSSDIINAIIGLDPVKPYMDLNHDGILSVGDSNIVLGCVRGDLNINELQKNGVNEITKVIEKSKSITEKEILEMLEIHSGEITYDETDEMYCLTLNKSYTYKELNDKFNEKYGCPLEFWGDGDISNQSTEAVKSGVEIYTGSIYYENIIGNTSYNYSSYIIFKIK